MLIPNNAPLSIEHKDDNTLIATAGEKGEALFKMNVSWSKVQ